MSTPDVDALLDEIAGREIVEPWNDQILVRPIEEDETTPAGLVLPPSSRKPVLQRGVVVAVAWGAKMVEPTLPNLEPGDRVCFDSYPHPHLAGPPAEITIEGVKHLLLSIDYIRGVIRRKGGA